MHWSIVKWRSLLRFLSRAASTAEIYTLSLHDALPILESMGDHARREMIVRITRVVRQNPAYRPFANNRSEEHTSELQSPYDLVCRLLLEKKKPKPTPPVGCTSTIGRWTRAIAGGKPLD